MAARLRREFVYTCPCDSEVLTCFPGKNPVPLNSRVKDLVNHIVPQLLEMYETEDNKYVQFCLFFGTLCSLDRCAFVMNILLSSLRCPTGA